MSIVHHSPSMLWQPKKSTDTIECFFGSKITPSWEPLAYILGVSSINSRQVNYYALWQFLSFNKKLSLFTLNSDKLFFFLFVRWLVFCLKMALIFLPGYPSKQFSSDWAHRWEEQKECITSKLVETYWSHFTPFHRAAASLFG